MISSDSKRRKIERSSSYSSSSGGGGGAKDDDDSSSHGGKFAFSPWIPAGNHKKNTLYYKVSEYSSALPFLEFESHIKWFPYSKPLFYGEEGSYGRTETGIPHSGGFQGGGDPKYFNSFSFGKLDLKSWVEQEISEDEGLKNNEFRNKIIHILEKEHELRKGISVRSAGEWLDRLKGDFNANTVNLRQKAVYNIDVNIGTPKESQIILWLAVIVFIDVLHGRSVRSSSSSSSSSSSDELKYSSKVPIVLPGAELPRTDFKELVIDSVYDICLRHNIRRTPEERCFARLWGDYVDVDYKGNNKYLKPNDGWKSEAFVHAWNPGGEEGYYSRVKGWYHAPDSNIYIAKQMLVNEKRAMYMVICTCGDYDLSTVLAEDAVQIALKLYLSQDQMNYLQMMADRNFIASSEIVHSEVSALSLGPLRL